jgi:fucose permease
VLPFAMGWLAQTYGVRYGFLMPLGCFVYIALYAAFWPALERLDKGHEVAD